MSLLKSLLCSRCFNLILKLPARPLSYKYVRNRWIHPYSLNDDFNLENREPDVYDQWYSESSEYVNAAETEDESLERYYEVLQDISGLPRRLKARLPNHKEFLPPQSHAETTRAYQRACLGQFGLKMSGIDPSVCWPNPSELKDEEALMDMTEAAKTVSECQAISAEQKRIDEEKRSGKIQKIEQAMAKMPEEMGKHFKRLEKEKQAEELRAETQKQLLKEAREFFGFKVDPRDEKFRKMKAMKEESELMRKKQLRKLRKNSRL